MGLAPNSNQEEKEHLMGKGKTIAAKEKPKSGATLVVGPNPENFEDGPQVVFVVLEGESCEDAFRATFNMEFPGDVTEDDYVTLRHQSDQEVALGQVLLGSDGSPSRLNLSCILSLAWNHGYEEGADGDPADIDDDGEMNEGVEE